MLLSNIMLLNSTVQLCGYLGNLMLEFSSARTIEQPHLDQHVPNQMALLDAGHLQRARQLGDLRFPAERLLKAFCLPKSCTTPPAATTMSLLS